MFDIVSDSCLGFADSCSFVVGLVAFALQTFVDVSSEGGRQCICFLKHCDG